MHAQHGHAGSSIEYVAECNRDAWIKPASKEGKIYLAGFEAALAENLYGGNVKASSTVHTYCQQVIWVLTQKDEVKVAKAVHRGVDKLLQDGKRHQGSLDITFFATLYDQFGSATATQSKSVTSGQLLKSVRNLLIYTFLGFGVQRSQSAVISVINQIKNPSRILKFGNVRMDLSNYCIWWALNYSKGDPFGRRKGKDGKDWTVTAGCRGKTHPIDVVKLYQFYCKLMGWSLDPRSAAFRRQQTLPFFQELDKRGTPTGAPLTYNSLLRALKNDVRDHFPDIDPADIGTHSFRRFGATYMKTKGIPDDLIQYMGRWISECFQRYFMFSDADKVDISRRMVS